MRSSAPSTRHAHGCSRCHTRYEDTCGISDADELCVQCVRGPGAGWQLLIENRKPKDCCRVFSRPATTDDRKRYALVGLSTWHLCTECGRTQAFDPSVPTERTKP